MYTSASRSTERCSFEPSVDCTLQRPAVRQMAAFWWLTSKLYRYSTHALHETIHTLELGGAVLFRSDKSMQLNVRYLEFCLESAFEIDEAALIAVNDKFWRCAYICIPLLPVNT